MANNSTKKEAPVMHINKKETELGVERLCTKCADYWPDDAQFFYLKSGKTQQPCKACFAELPSRLARKKLNKK
jgi:hypothetical protein